MSFPLSERGRIFLPLSERGEKHEGDTFPLSQVVQNVTKHWSFTPHARLVHSPARVPHRAQTTPASLYMSPNPFPLWFTHVSRGVGPRSSRGPPKATRPPHHRLPKPCPHVGHGSTAAHKQAGPWPGKAPQVVQTMSTWRSRTRLSTTRHRQPLSPRSPSLCPHVGHGPWLNNDLHKAGRLPGRTHNPRFPAQVTQPSPVRVHSRLTQHCPPSWSSHAVCALFTAQVHT